MRLLCFAGLILFFGAFFRLHHLLVMASSHACDDNVACLHCVHHMLVASSLEGWESEKCKVHF